MTGLNLQQYGSGCQFPVQNQGDIIPYIVYNKRTQKLNPQNDK